VNIQELEQRLFEEGCNSSLYAIGARGGASDAFCLAHDGEKWCIYYTERGQDDAPIFVSNDENDVCQFFFQKIMSMRHSHCVGFFRSQERAKCLCKDLEQQGLNASTDKIPYHVDEPRYRVFVVGKDIFQARELLGEVPVYD
jgi:hypothetical protein